MTSALVCVAILIVIGVLLRQWIPLFRWLHVPGSIVAGFVGLAIVQGLLAGGGAFEGGANWAKDVSRILSGWPGWLIAVIFAGMLMQRGGAAVGESFRRAARQGLMVWIIVLGETAVGLVVVWLIVQQSFDVPNSFGMLIETGFAGGHGTAAAMGEVFAHPTIGLESGKDLGMLMATFGLVFGVVSGILWINLGIRLGWVKGLEREEPSDSGVASLGRARIDAESIDPLLLQAVWLTLAFGIGLLMQWLVMSGAGAMDQFFFTAEADDAAGKQLAKRLTVSNVVDFPLFIYTLFGGWFVRKILEMIGRADWIDGQTINRLTGMAMDVLVVAAIASLNLAVVANLAVPFLTLFIAGAIWAAICLLLLSRWILPKEYWFQLGLINYGMSTGTTATGFVLLKMVDAKLESGAAEDYALAAPLSAPFVGGGILTVALPLLVLERVSIVIPAMVISAVVVGLVVVGVLTRRQD